MKKKVFMAVLVASMFGCRNKTILHTYYGDLSTDTLKVLLDDSDGSSCYMVYAEAEDTFVLKKGGTLFIEGPIEVYFNPQKSVYYKVYPSSGNSSSRIVKYNPHDDTYD